MVRSDSLRVLLFVFLTLAMALASGSLATADDHEASQAQVEYRQKLMSVIGTNMGAISDILKNRLAVPGAVANHANQMADAAALIAPAFKKELIQGATDAKPEIWSDWAGFEAAIADYESAARVLAAAAEGDDPGAVGSAMRGLGKSCGGCHKPFRKPKEESYKNR